MARKIPGEFVPLDVNLSSDPKIRMAGPDAELLYIRGLAYIKRTKSDGFIPEYDLTALAAGCRNVRPSAAALTRVSLWVKAESDDIPGWICASWLKWNMSQQEIIDAKAQRKLGALTTNHGKGLHAETPAMGCPECEQTTAA